MPDSKPETARVPMVPMPADYLMRVQCLIECCALDPPMNVERAALEQLHGETLAGLATV
jgi:hypothetical protein